MVILYCDQDGEKILDVLPKAEFIRKLNSEWYGKNPTFAQPGEKITLTQFVGIIVIDGDIVTPKAKKVVTEFELA